MPIHVGNNGQPLSSFRNSSDTAEREKKNKKRKKIKRMNDMGL